MAVLAACDINALTARAACFNCLSRTEKMALKVHLMAMALRGYGGIDIVNGTVRNNAVACLSCKSDFALDSMEVAIWQKLAALSGQNVDLPIAALRKMVQCHPCGQTKLNRAAWTYLLCNLTLLGR